MGVPPRHGELMPPAAGIEPAPGASGDEMPQAWPAPEPVPSPTDRRAASEPAREGGRCSRGERWP